MNNIKEFLYLDQEYLNSYMSQINDGAIKTKVLELINEANSFTDNIPSTDKYAVKGNFEGNAAIVKGGASSEITHVSEGTRTAFLETELGKEMLIKQIHDNAFHDLLSYIEKNNLICDENKIEITKYIHSSSEFKIFDFNYLCQLMNKDIIDLIISSNVNGKMQELEAKKKATPSNVNTKFLNKKVKDVKDEIKKQTKQDKELYEFAIKMLNYIKIFIPSNVMLVNDNFVIPLKEKYLREESKTLNFKYDNENLFFLGKITRLHENYGGSIELLEPINEMVDIFINIFGLDLKNKYIISPIAIYY